VILIDEEDSQTTSSKNGQIGKCALQLHFHDETTLRLRRQTRNAREGSYENKKDKRIQFRLPQCPSWSPSTTIARHQLAQHLRIAYRCVLFRSKVRAIKKAR